MPVGISSESSVRSYGSLPEEEAPEAGWIKRGRMDGLLEDLVIQYGAHVCILFYMCAAGLFGGLGLDRHFSCKLGPENKVIQTHVGSAICEYSKTYVWSFPEVTLASLILLIGRDLAQKRFYYCLLKSGGVMSFIPHPLHRDSVVVANFWVFGQFWIFVGLVLLRLYVKGADPNIAVEEAAKAAAAAAANPNARVEYDADHLANSGDPHGLQLLVKLLAMLGIPGMLVIIRLLSAYNLESTLVPLSEYVRDSRLSVQHVKESCLSDDLSEVDRKRTEAQLAGCLESVELMSGTIGNNLVCVKDNCICALLRMHIDRILEEDSCADERYKKVLDLYWREGWYKLSEEPPSIDLLDGLWTAPFVMATPSTLTTTVSWSFLTVWNLYRKIGGMMCAVIIFIQVLAIIVDTSRIFVEHPCAGFAVIGECFNVYFVGLVWYRIYLACPHVESVAQHPQEKTAEQFVPA